MLRRAPLLLFTALFWACGPGACQRSLELELCANVAPEGDCMPPSGGFAAGLGYGLRARGEGLPREVVLVETELREKGESREVARMPVEVPEGAERVHHPVFFPALGRYRLEVRAKSGAVLGRLDVDVTVATARPAARD